MTMIDGTGENATTPRLGIVVALPERRTLVDPHRAELRASGLTDETIELAEVYTEVKSKAIAELLRRRSFPRHQGSALVFPLFTPGASEPYGYRCKPASPRKNRQGKVIKYEQPEGEGLVLVYFPPRARCSDKYRDVSAPLVWTEGEKKSLALDQLGFTSIGLTGVYNWLDSQHRKDSGEWRLSPLIRDHVTIAGRHHVIVFDHDAHENDQVMTAARRLCGVLIAAGATSVKFATPPTREHKGIDDYLAAFGDEPTRAVIDAAEKIDPLDPSSPYVLASTVRALKDAPIPESLRLPDGYRIQKDGTLWKLGDEKHDDAKIANSPILIVRHLHDHETREVRAEITWRRDATWQSVCVPRRALFDSRILVSELVDRGAPVTSNNAPRVVDFFEELERVNADTIPRVYSVARSGWHTIDGIRCFVLAEPSMRLRLQ